MAKTDPIAPQQQTLAVAKPQQNFLVFDSIEHFEHALRMCKCLASANMLPKHFQGEQNIGNCMIALEIAHRGQLPVMEVLQNLIVVQGRTSWYATYIIGRINSCGLFSTLEWESENDGTANWRMRAKATELKTGKELIGSWVSLQMARDEHWGGKWQTMPEQMLRYRSAAFWQRLYAPNITMGIKDQYEVEDIAFEEVKPADNPDEAERKNAAAIAALQESIGKKKPETPATSEPEKPADQPAEGAQEPKPLVEIVVEQPEGEQKPKPESYEATLERAKRNLGIPTNAQESSEINFESSEQ